MARIRDATAGDWPGVAALLAELGRPDVLGSDDEALHREQFAAYLERPDTAALVAEDGGRIVGFLDMEYRRRLNFLQPEAWIPDLIVTDDARSKGVGGALLSRAEELARAQGCWVISLESAIWRDRAHSFYLREGWEDSGKAFTKLLVGAVWPPLRP